MHFVCVCSMVFALWWVSSHHIIRKADENKRFLDEIILSAHIQWGKINCLVFQLYPELNCVKRDAVKSFRKQRKTIFLCFVGVDSQPTANDLEWKSHYCSKTCFNQKHKYDVYECFWLLYMGSVMLNPHTIITQT